ncbi:UNVERIFIED_CONTAM: Ptpre [Trichonephila clavipes]
MHVLVYIRRYTFKQKRSYLTKNYGKLSKITTVTLFLVSGLIPIRTCEKCHLVFVPVHIDRSGKFTDFLITCSAFWPPSGSVYQGSIKIQHLASEAEYFGGVLIRKFSVKNPKGKRRTVKTFHLHGWRREDFVPPQVDTIVQLIAKMDKWTKKSGPAPVIVTCYSSLKS